MLPIIIRNYIYLVLYQQSTFLYQSCAFFFLYSIELPCILNKQEIQHSISIESFLSRIFFPLLPLKFEIYSCSKNFYFFCLFFSLFFTSMKYRLSNTFFFSFFLIPLFMLFSLLTIIKLVYFYLWFRLPKKALSRNRSSTC